MAFWRSLDLSKVLSPNNNLLNVPTEVTEQETPPVIDPYKKGASSIRLECSSIPAAEENNMTEPSLTNQDPHTPQHQDHICTKKIKKDIAIIKIQAFVRCHIQRKKFYIDKLQRRLNAIQKEKENALSKIERRKNKKFKKLRDMFHEEHIRKEHEAEQRYRVVTGILGYLKREMKQAQLDLERNTRRCENLKTQNQCLISTTASMERSVVGRKQKVISLESANARLQDEMNILKEAVALLGHHCQRIAATCTTGRSSSSTVGLKTSSTGRRRSQGRPRVNSYSNTIAVDCGVDSEDPSCTYQLVQEVYILSSRHTH